MSSSLAPVLQRLPAFAPKTECRVYERFACHIETSCKPPGGNEMRWVAILRDVSRSGVRLNLGRRFEAGSGLAIEVPPTADEEAYTVFAKVVWVGPADAGGWTLGCKFVSELSEDELRRLLAPAKPLDAAAVPARLIIPEVVLEIATPTGPVVARVQRFHAPTDWPLAPGKILTIRGVGQGGERLQHRFEVLRCRQRGDGWALKVQFADPTMAPSWARPGGG